LSRISAGFFFKFFGYYNLDNDVPVLFGFVGSCYLRIRVGIYPTANENFFWKFDIVDSN